MRRYNARAYEELLLRGWERQKGLCSYCRGMMPDPRERRRFPRRERPTLQHTDHNSGNDGSVKEVMHLRCNDKEFAEFTRRAIAEKMERDAREPTGQGEREKKALEFVRTLPRFKIIPRDSDSYSNKKHEEAAPLYRRYWFNMIINGFRSGRAYSESELTKAGSEFVGVETVTAERYNARLLGFMGPCATQDEGELAGGEKNGREVVVFKDLSFYYLSVDELLELFPVEGQRAVDSERAKKLLDQAAERLASARDALMGRGGQGKQGEVA